MIFRAQLEQATAAAWDFYEHPAGPWATQAPETKERALAMVQRALEVYASLPKRPRKAK